MAPSTPPNIGEAQEYKQTKENLEAAVKAAESADVTQPPMSLEEFEKAMKAQKEKIATFYSDKIADAYKQFHDGVLTQAEYTQSEKDFETAKTQALNKFQDFEEVRLYEMRIYLKSAHMAYQKKLDDAKRAAAEKVKAQATAQPAAGVAEDAPTGGEGDVEEPPATEPPEVQPEEAPPQNVSPDDTSDHVYFAPPKDPIIDQTKIAVQVDSTPPSPYLMPPLDSASAAPEVQQDTAAEEHIQENLLKARGLILNINKSVNPDGTLRDFGMRNVLTIYAQRPALRADRQNIEMAMDYFLHFQRDPDASAGEVDDETEKHFRTLLKVRDTLWEKPAELSAAEIAIVGEAPKEMTEETVYKEAASDYAARFKQGKAFVKILKEKGDYVYGSDFSQSLKEHHGEIFSDGRIPVYEAAVGFFDQDPPPAYDPNNTPALYRHANALQELSKILADADKILPEASDKKDLENILSAANTTIEGIKKLVGIKETGELNADLTPDDHAAFEYFSARLPENPTREDVEIADQHLVHLQEFRQNLDEKMDEIPIVDSEIKDGIVTFTTKEDEARKTLGDEFPKAEGVIVNGVLGARIGSEFFDANGNRLTYVGGNHVSVAGDDQQDAIAAIQHKMGDGKFRDRFWNSAASEFTGKAKEAAKKANSYVSQLEEEVKKDPPDEAKVRELYGRARMEAARAERRTRVGDIDLNADNIQKILDDARDADNKALSLWDDYRDKHGISPLPSPDAPDAGQPVAGPGAEKLPGGKGINLKKEIADNTEKAGDVIRKIETLQGKVAAGTATDEDRQQLAEHAKTLRGIEARAAKYKYAEKSEAQGLLKSVSIAAKAAEDLSKKGVAGAPAPEKAPGTGAIAAAPAEVPKTPLDAQIADGQKIVDNITPEILKIEKKIQDKTAISADMERLHGYQKTLDRIRSDARLTDAKERGDGNKLLVDSARMLDKANALLKGFEGKAFGSPEEIRQAHEAVVASYESGMERFRTLMEAIPDLNDPQQIMKNYAEATGITQRLSGEIDSFLAKSGQKEPMNLGNQQFSKGYPASARGLDNWFAVAFGAGSSEYKLINDAIVGARIFQNSPERKEAEELAQRLDYTIKDLAQYGENFERATNLDGVIGYLEINLPKLSALKDKLQTAHFDSFVSGKNLIKIIDSVSGAAQTRLAAARQRREVLAAAEKSLKEAAPTPVEPPPAIETKKPDAVPEPLPSDTPGSTS